MLGMPRIGFVAHSIILITDYFDTLSRPGEGCYTPDIGPFYPDNLLGLPENL